MVSTSISSLANCEVIRSTDYDYEDVCETVRVYELCIPIRPQGCHLVGILHDFNKRFKLISVPCSPCGRGAVVERTPSVTKVVSSILAQSERDFVGGRERTL